MLSTLDSFSIPVPTLDTKVPLTCGELLQRGGADLTHDLCVVLLLHLPALCDIVTPGCRRAAWAGHEHRESVRGALGTREGPSEATRGHGCSAAAPRLLAAPTATINTPWSNRPSVVSSSSPSES
eukprot:scaffold73748_cov69-Phaeocystis_antarctica.AAC.9